MFSTLLFLEDCLVPARNSKFKNTTKERAWQAYHQAVYRHMAAVAEKSSFTVAPWLCLTTFRLLVKLTYESEIHSEEYLPLLDTEHDIVDYIGGFVIHKLRKHAIRLKDKEVGEGIIECLEQLTCNESESASSTLATGTVSATVTTATGTGSATVTTATGTGSATNTTANARTLTAVLDRGGLTKLNGNTCQMFLTLEHTFRSLFGDESKVNASFATYFDKCCQQETVSSCFYDLLCRTDSTDSLKEKILKDIIHLYFKVRMHHKCKIIMDSYRRKTKTTKKSKGIRKQLNTSSASR